MFSAMLAAGRPPPPFIDQGGAAYKHAAWLFEQCRGTGIQCLRFEGCPGESRFLHVSWRLLCLFGGGFEGGPAGAHVWLSSVPRFEGLADERARVAQGLA
jgi:hypothetical protein